VCVCIYIYIYIYIYMVVHSATKIRRTLRIIKQIGIFKNTNFK
jgi:hypothetical protein